MTNLNDLIGPVIFLSSEMSSYITGQNIFVDGGFSIK
jgi:enoyl-[acyl-carrier-protein] reductase (NADH)